MRTPLPHLWSLRVHLTFRQQAVAASAALIACVAASVVGLQLSLAQANERSGLVAHVHEVIGAAGVLARDAVQAQAGVRGYALTGDRSFLDQFVEGSALFRRDAARLTALIREEPEQLARIGRLMALYDAWREGSAEPLIENTSQEVQTQARALVISGRRQMDALRATADELMRAEEEQLGARQQARDASMRWLNLLSVIATGLVVLLGAGGAVLFTQRLSRRLSSVVTSARAITQGNLGERLATTGDDELSDLARSFNEMAGHLEASDRDGHLLNQLREMLHAAHTMEDVQRIIPAFVPACLPGSSGRIHLLNPSRNLLTPTVEWGVNGGEDPFPPEACWSFRLGRSHVVTGTEPVGVRCAHSFGAAGSTACIPLMAQGDVIGLLHYVFQGERVPPLVGELGAVLALTVANMRLREALRNQAARDPLTGLFNRRYLEETMVREFARSRRTGTPLSVVMVDIDHFKRFNDTYGHAAGDAVLKVVAGVLRSTFRTADVVCRHGGEEFLVLMPDCSAPDALRRAETVRVGVSGLSVMHEGRPLESVTISAGVASFPGNGDARDVLVQAADAALYRSKREGRNRVTPADLITAPLALVPGD